MLRPSKKYLHCIIDTSGKSYYVDGLDRQNNPVIKLSATPNWLTFSPKNWQDVQIAFGRDFNKYHGYNRTFTTPYEFVEDGADIVTNLAIKKGYENVAILIIMQHNDANDTYETLI